MSSIDDARLWVGKTVAQTSTSSTLRSALKKVLSLLDDAEASVGNENYLLAADKTQYALDLVESALSQEEWPTDGYDYAEKVSSQTVPELEDLADEFESQV